MMKWQQIDRFLQNHVGLVMIVAAALGLLVPYTLPGLTVFLAATLVAILLITLLKLEFFRIKEEGARFGRVLGLLAVYSILTPILLFYIVYPFNETLATGLLLLTLVPPGVSSSALTDLFRGNVALSLVLTVAGHLLTPVMMLIVFLFVPLGDLQVPLAELLLTTCVIIGLPFLLAYLLKRWRTEAKMKQIAEKISGLNSLILGSSVYFAIASQAEVILANWYDFWVPIMIIFGLMLLAHLVGYLLVFRSSNKDKVAVMTTNTYRNNALAMVLAFGFFSPEVAIIAILTDIPFAVLPLFTEKLAHWLVRE